MGFIVTFYFPLRTFSLLFYAYQYFLKQLKSPGCNKYLSYFALLLFFHFPFVSYTTVCPSTPDHNKLFFLDSAPTTLYVFESTHIHSSSLKYRGGVVITINQVFKNTTTTVSNIRSYKLYVNVNTA